MKDTNMPASGIHCDKALELNAKQAIEHIMSWLDLHPQRRRDLVSAVNCVVKSGALPPDLIIMTPIAIRTTLLQRSAAAMGVTERTMKNVRSALRYTLCRLGIIDSRDAPLSSGWSTLLGQLNTVEAAGLIRFARFCSARQIDPTKVGDGTLGEFHEWLIHRTLTVQPRKAAGTVRLAWNRHANSLPGWPAVRLNALSPAGQYILPLDAFPASFQKSVTDFGVTLQASPFDAFDEDDDGQGALNDDAASPIAKPLRAISAANREAHARWAASGLVASGVQIDAITSVNDLVSPLAHAKAILRFTRDRKGGKKSAAGAHIGAVLLMIARHYAKLSPSDIAEIKKWVRVVALTYDGMTEKNRTTLAEVMHPEREGKLLALSGVLLSLAHQLLPSSPRQAASLALRAVAVEFLSRSPLRLKNVVEIRLDQHLQRRDPKRLKISHIHFPAEETKNGREILMLVPPTLDAALAQWITVFRPIIASPDCVYLFPGDGTGNRPITPQALREAVRSITHQHVGVAMTPHQFRHLAATRFLEAHPDGHESVRQLLGHASVETTIKHYAGSRAEAAMARFDDVILARTRSVGSKERSAGGGSSPKKRRSGVRHG